MTEQPKGYEAQFNEIIRLLGLIVKQGDKNISMGKQMLYLTEKAMGELND